MNKRTLDSLFIDHEGDSVTVESHRDGVALLIPGYGVMTFDADTAMSLAKAMVLAAWANDQNHDNENAHPIPSRGE